MRLPSAFLLLTVLSVSAFAGDGVIEINQAAAAAGGVTPGDAAGLPVTLSESGSYRLTGNLALPDENTGGILITADHVTVDLGGFAIIGPTFCTSVPNTPTTTCGPTGSGDGISGDLPGGFAPENITIRNGTVRGAGNRGITLIFGRVERVRVISNGSSGIEVPIGLATDGEAPGTAIVESWAIRNGFKGIAAGQRGRVENSIASFNGDLGIDCGQSCVVRGNTANWNGAGGIFCSGCVVENNAVDSNTGAGITAGRSVVRGNTVINNTGFGLVLNGASGFAENVLSTNAGGTVDGGGFETGGNVCNGTVTCP